MAHTEGADNWVEVTGNSGINSGNVSITPGSDISTTVGMTIASLGAGSINIAPVSGSSVITAPIFRPADGEPILTKIPAPTTATTATDLTEAQLLGGIHVKTPTAAQNLQVPTGTQISTAVAATAVGGNLAVGDSFDWTMINLGGTGDDVTITVDTGVTFVGDVVMRPVANADTEQAGQATWRFRNTAANTWIGYRVA